MKKNTVNMRVYERTHKKLKVLSAKKGKNMMETFDDLVTNYFR